MRLTPAFDAIRFAAALLLACSVCTPAFAQTAVDLQLVLAVDASGSVDQRRFELQMQGYVAAFRDPRVLYAIQSGATQAIAVTMVQWTGPALQIQVLPWTVIQDATTAHAFAAAIVATPRQLFSGGTSISGVIDYAVPLMLESPFKGTRRVIDISGDGSNNRGRPAASARDDAVRAGIIINGLPILALEPDLERYFADHVIGGPGAFVIAAESYETFADAILKKLIREMAAHEPRPHAEWNISRPFSLRAMLSGFEGYGAFSRPLRLLHPWAGPPLLHPATRAQPSHKPRCAAECTRTKPRARLDVLDVTTDSHAA